MSKHTPPSHEPSPPHGTIGARLPPKLATWLLERLYTARRAESLIGDLHEQFAAGRSKGWYWRQVLIAIVTPARQAVRVHALSFVGAIVAGWIVMFAWFAFNMWMTGPNVVAVSFVRRTFDISSYHYAWMTIYFVAATTRVIVFALAGWLTVRIHRAHPYAVALALIASVYLVRFVPWRTYKAFDFDTMAIIHNVTALGGLMLGAAWAVAKEKRRAHAVRGVQV
jgi:hypothetical protein